MHCVYQNKNPIVLNCLSVFVGARFAQDHQPSVCDTRLQRVQRERFTSFQQRALAPSLSLILGQGHLGLGIQVYVDLGQVKALPAARRVAGTHVNKA